MMFASLLFAAAALSIGEPPAKTAETPAAPKAGPHATPRLICEAKTVAPGTTVTLGLTFDIDPGWHVYWKGDNDSGMPISFTLTLPEGWKQGETQWPAPVRHTQEGDILDYVYEKEVTLLIPVTIPADAKAATAALINVDAKWLVCKEICLAENGPARLKLMILGTTTEPLASPDAPRIKAARERVPAPFPTKDSGFSLAWKDGALALGAKGASGLTFHVAAGSAKLKDPIKTGDGRSEKLDLSFSPSDSGSRRVLGVLEVRREGKPTEFYDVSTEMPN